MGGLVNRLRDFLWPHIRSALVWFSAVVAGLAERVNGLRRPQIRPALAWFSAVVAGLADRVHALRPAFRRPHEEPLETVSARRPNRLEALKWRVRMSRLGRSADGIIVLPLLGAVLVLGVFTATAATRGSSPPGEESDLTPAANTTVEGSTGEIVTETITRKGKTLRVVRYRTRTKPGRVVLETVSGRSVTLPGHSVTIPGASVTLPGHTKTVVETETRTRTVTVPTVTTVTVISTTTETIPVTTTEPPPQG